MKNLYSLAGISKQAIHKYEKRKDAVLDVTMQVVQECNRIRSKHPRMGCRRMYQTVADKFPIGRDIFEQIGFNNGFKLKIKKNPVKTTWSTKMQAFDNLLEGKTLNNINQSWQCDFFYLKVEGINFYGVTIIDVYSRKLLALHISKSLNSTQLNKAFQKALKERKQTHIKDCIFHSDRGSQFFAKEFKSLLEGRFRQSMCKLPQENAYVERVQGTIKHEYIFEMELTVKNLQRQISFIQYLYNHKRPHTQLNYLSPVEFEQSLDKTGLQSNPQLTIYQWHHPLLTNNPLTNKEKSTKKETITN